MTKLSQWARMSAKGWSWRRPKASWWVRRDLRRASAGLYQARVVAGEVRPKRKVEVRSPGDDIGVFWDGPGSQGKRRKGILETRDAHGM